MTTLVSIIAPYSASFDVFSGNAYFDGRPIPISNLDAIVQALGKTKGAFSHASNWDLFSYRLDKNGKIASESYVGVIPLSKNPTREEIVSRLVDYAGIPNIVIQSKTDSVVEAEQENYTAEGGYTVPLFRLERKGSGSMSRSSKLTTREINTILDQHALWAGRHNADGARISGQCGRFADLRGADLSGSNLGSADLRGADLRGADLTGADLTGTQLKGARLSNANLTDADLEQANLKSADLTDADLTGADLTGANVSYANLTRADLTRANFTGANLFRALLTDAHPKAVRVALGVDVVGLGTLGMSVVKGSGSAARYDESRDAPGLYPISSLRLGAYFKRKPDAKKVYRRGDYDRSERTYAGLDTDDISRSIALKGDTRVYVGFDY